MFNSKVTIGPGLIDRVKTISDCAANESSVPNESKQPRNQLKRSQTAPARSFDLHNQNIAPELMDRLRTDQTIYKL